MNGFLKGKLYGTVSIGERGQLVIPAELRVKMKIKSGDKLLVFAKPEKRMIGLMREEDFSAFLDKASKIISKLENKVTKKN